ncbi:placenta-specific protein 9 isoform X1 [Tympanuchus pallidicinctus]|uniref:placenta-specific protein 9 isoform X1 n=1 Tax=Tympanuchus pallidicinctus TaxID=109042 RepID=UPI002287240C|nr:placenta-specific protein 9 isoform X1 [Tympanuchus pallidicinctus]
MHSLGGSLPCTAQDYRERGTMLFIWVLVFAGVLQEHELFAAADPTSLLPGSLGSWCHEHDTMHERLDIIEEKVIKTVEHLESEVKSLLSIISETTSDLPIAAGTPLIDLFDGKYLVGYKLSQQERCMCYSKCHPLFPH